MGEQILMVLQNETSWRPIFTDKICLISLREEARAIHHMSTGVGRHSIGPQWVLLMALIRDSFNVFGTRCNLYWVETLQPAHQRGIITILMMVINDQDETFQRSRDPASTSFIMPLMDPTLVGFGIRPNQGNYFLRSWSSTYLLGCRDYTSLVFDDVV